MVRAVRWYLVGVIGGSLLGLLEGCSSGHFLAERDPWRAEAEAKCLSSGNVKEGVGVVRVTPIRGPGVCGADYPLRVSLLGESTALAFGDDPRPPAGLPQSSQPRWPIASSPYESTSQQPLSLDPPRVTQSADASDAPYDFRVPYGTPKRPPRTSSANGSALAGSPAFDLSPVPYDHRPVLSAPAGRYDAPSLPSSTPAPMGGAPSAPALGGARAPLTSAAVTPVALSPTATLACPLVSVLNEWIAEAVQPAALHWFGQPVVEIKQISAYSCRGMNGDPHAHISEHAFGNALDIAAFIFADGSKLTVEKGWHGAPEEQGFLRDVQAAACQRFTTVLAPGSNRFHYNHIHVDLMRRRNGYRACNPRAVSGEDVAARVRGSFATGSIGRTRMAGPQRRAGASSMKPLPFAKPGEDGEDDE